jgi:hypothetical protein
MPVKRYRKLPVTIEAVQWTGENTAEIEEFVGDATPGEADHFVDGRVIPIRTLEGTHRTQVGDYVIRGVQGEFYPCKPNIFDATYEAVS